MYDPQVNDYVRWTTELGMVHEGWVYFKADQSKPKKGNNASLIPSLQKHVRDLEEKVNQKNKEITNLKNLIQLMQQKNV